MINKLQETTLYELKVLRQQLLGGNE